MSQFWRTRASSSSGRLSSVLIATTNSSFFCKLVERTVNRDLVIECPGIVSLNSELLKLHIPRGLKSPSRASKYRMALLNGLGGRSGIYRQHTDREREL